MKSTYPFNNSKPNINNSITNSLHFLWFLFHTITSRFNPALSGSYMNQKQHWGLGHINLNPKKPLASWKYLFPIQFMKKKCISMGIYTTPSCKYQPPKTTRLLLISLSYTVYEIYISMDINKKKNYITSSCGRESYINNTKD